MKKFPWTLITTSPIHEAASAAMNASNFDLLSGVNHDA